MIKLLTLTMLTFSLNANAKLEVIENEVKVPAKTEYSKVATVHGMVCAFCSSSLEKKFKKNKAVENINVDLGQKQVRIKFKKGKSITDKKLKKMITTSGFKVVSIEAYNSKSPKKEDLKKADQKDQKKDEPKKGTKKAA